MKKICREAAKAKGLKRYFTGEPCKNGHIGERYVKTYGCIECQREFRKDPDELNKRNAAKWVRYHNDSEFAARILSYRHAAKHRSVAWADKEKIARVYELCRIISEDTGIPHEVDHIIPLRGDAISGLHVHQNLQILTAEENRAKGNKY